MFNRRCGFLSFTVLAILAFLVCAPVAFPQAVTMVQSSARSAGSSAFGYNGDFGPATTVNLSNPSYMVFDSNGNQFVSDTLNNCVRKIDTAGNITTVAGLAVSGQSDTCNTALDATPPPTATQGLYQPTGLAIDSSNRLYIADSGHNCVRALVSGDTGVANLVTVAGTCGSVPTASVTPAPNGLAIDASNNLYISIQDSASAIPVNQVIQHAFVAAPTNVCLVAGVASANVSNQCAGVPAGISLVRPSGLAMDVSGDLYIADTGNNCVRKVGGVASGSATQSTAVGQCLNDGSGNSATAVHNPYGLAVSPMQSLFISESSPDNVVSFVPGSTSLKIVGGLPSGVAGPYDSSQDGKSALNSPLNGPRGLAFDSVAHLFVADSLNNIIRELSSNLSFAVTPVGSPSSIQPITFAINQPVNLTASTGTDYSITSTTCTGNLSPAAAGAPPNTCQVFVRFVPTRPGVRRSALKITDSISNTSVFQGLQGIGTGALSIFTPGTSNTIASNLASPASIVTDAAGNAYVLETAVGAGTPDIRMIPAGGGSSTPIITSNLATPTAIALDAAGNIYVADATHGTVTRFGADGSVNTSYVTGLDTPVALYVDQFYNLYIAQAGASHNVIVAYASGAERVIAGSGSNPAADGVPATSASFVSPSAVTMDLNGLLYIADQGGHRVFAVDPTGIIHIVAGTGGTSTILAGQAVGTALVAPSSLTTDAADDVYIADQGAGIIYAVTTSSTNGNNIHVVLNISNPPAPNGTLSISIDGSGNLFVSENAANSVNELIYPNPTLNFGTVMVPNTSAVMLQNITNIGNENININSPFSTTDSHFAVNSGSTTCGTSILTGSACTVGFTFTPTASVTYSASSIVNSNSFNTPQPITLIGTGKLVTTLGIGLVPETEVYGQPFATTVNFSNFTTAPTGTITFTHGTQILCTLTGTFSATTTCNAPASGLSVGNYPVAFSYSGDSNYNAATGNTTLTVTQAPLTEVVNNATRAYGAPNPAFSGTLTGVAPGDTILVAFSTTAIVTSPVGSYPITATLTPAGSTSLSNYSITNTPGVLTITTATPTYALPTQTEVYGQPFPEPFSINGTIPGVPSTGTISFSIGKTTLCTLTGTFAANNVCNAPNSGLAVGTYTVGFNYSGDANYAPYSGSTTLTVTPAALTVTVANASRAYGVANPAFTSTITGTVGTDTFTQTFSTPATINSPVGTYVINDVLSGAATSNYTVTVIPGTLTITKASVALNVAVNNVSRNYGAANPAFTSTITGALNGDTFTVTYSTTATATSPVGTYPIIPTVSGANLGNYTLTTTNGMLTVLPAPLTVVANNASRPYGTANPTFTSTITGLVNGDTVTVTYQTTAVVNSPVGVYPIIQTVSGPATSNYNVSAINGQLTVTANANSLVINVNSAARLYGAQNPAFSGTVTGVLPGDNVIVTYSTVATPASNAASYPIGASVSGTSAGNYIATINPGTLVVSPATTVTAVATSAPTASAGTNVTFTANVTGNPVTAVGTVTFFDGTVMLGTSTLNGSGVAQFSTSTLSVGTHSITAAFQANTNFTTSSASVPQIITQATGAFTVSATPPAPFIKGAGTTTFQVTVTATGAFAGPVALTCSGLPSDATCAFANPTVTLTAGGSITTAMTVTTTAADAKLLIPAGLPDNPADIAPLTVATIFPVELTGLGVLFAGIRRRKTLGTQKMRLLLLIVCTLGILGLAGCGCPSTTFRTYTINITGTSLSFPAPAQTTTVVLSVGQQ